MTKTDVIVIGAGASGLMCAAAAGRRGRRVLVVDHAQKPGRKILISGGGKCNFTNLRVSAENYFSQTPPFCDSALSRYSQRHFIELVQRHRIPYHEREHGQLFCDRSARDILDMLLAECRSARVTLVMNTPILSIEGGNGFRLHTGRGSFECESLVIATGGPAYPSVGATAFGYRVAEQFGLPVVTPRPGLVPFTLQPKDKEILAPLSGIAVEAMIDNGRVTFRENLLFTHRGLSGPAALQMSCYWQGEELTVNLLPGIDLFKMLKKHQAEHPRQMVKSALIELLPKRLLKARLAGLSALPLRHLTPAQAEGIAARLQEWRVKPGGTEGYRTAEVTAGGVDCAVLSPKTLEVRTTPGLFFIGEVVDVTGQLGGYNLQWAWSSGWCAGQAV